MGKSLKAVGTPNFDMGNELKGSQSKNEADFLTDGCHSPTPSSLGTGLAKYKLLGWHKSGGFQICHYGTDRCGPGMSVGLGESSGLWS